MEVVRVTPAVINNEIVTASVLASAKQTLQNANLDTTPFLTMGAEDMGYMQEKVDGCYFFIGSNNKEKHLDYNHHHPKFDFDEQALIHGAALMSAAAADLLK
jgi:amidohydrolase